MTYSYGAQQSWPNQKESKSTLGMVSFVMGLVVIALLIIGVSVVIVSAISMHKEHARQHQAWVDSQSSGDSEFQIEPAPKPILPTGMLIMVAITGCGGSLLALIGTILGIISLTKPGPRVYAILGWLSTADTSPYVCFLES